MFQWLTLKQGRNSAVATERTTTVNEFHKPTAPALVDGVDGEQSDIELLHGISMELIAEHNHVELYGKIVDAAISITGSQFGTMQLLCPEGDASGHGGELGLLCSRGLCEESVKFWQWVSPDGHSSCTEALKSGRREIISDYEKWEVLAGTDDLLAFQQTGIRAAQTTPLLSRDGNLLGMISTHWSEPHTPSDRDLRLLDILARQAADLLERTIAEETRQAHADELDRTCLALRETEELQKLLTAELSHRVKNMLATVQAIASQTLRHSKDPADFVKSFGGRIQSMSRVHSQLSNNEWKGTQLGDVVHDQMKFGPVDETQISASGPSIYLNATYVPKIAMILHELGTNSLKYGALSKPEGKVNVEWSATEHALSLTWAETGGPEIVEPIKRGFGTKLIEATAQGAGGFATMTIEPHGVRWSFGFSLPVEPPASKLAKTPDPIRTMVPNDNAATLAPQAEVKALSGKTILVVEDETLVALDIIGQLEAAGADVIGPAGNVASALELIAQHQFDAALLDGNLGGDPVDKIAAALARRNVPFAFVSGYSRDSLPASFSDAELLSKPFEEHQLLAIVAKLVA